MVDCIESINYLVWDMEASSDDSATWGRDWKPEMETFGATAVTSATWSELDTTDLTFSNETITENEDGDTAAQTQAKISGFVDNIRYNIQIEVVFDTGDELTRVQILPSIPR